MKVDTRERSYAWKDPTPALAAGATLDGLRRVRPIDWPVNRESTAFMTTMSVSHAMKRRRDSVSIDSPCA